MATLLLQTKATEGLREVKHTKKGENVIPNATFNTYKLGQLTEIS